ncbi:MULTISPECIES: sulfotransferase [unclassified Pseudodesulfovibrio]|uniref:sulfotransferase n=1 Tax=unclassified Pseudodesulfovibrio TaxID=2661612 RepID=UPI0013E3BEED|nr:MULTISPECIES: sulfotransferase [unclassified Pseudodesulfovibrio]MCJ2166237.1 sulfotransferase [Pseudodesulfovibrio sp. S3-i]
MKETCHFAGVSVPKTTVGSVFIGGTGRSGTSLLRRALNSNPDVASVPGETKCINDERFRLAPHWFHGLPSGSREQGVKDLKRLWRERFYCYVHPHKASLKDNQLRGFCLWLDREAMEAELSRLDELVRATSLHEVEAIWGGLYAALFRHRSQAQGKSHWVEKTPRNSFFAEYLYSIIPDMRLINMVRDGRDVALSMQNVAWGEKDYVKALDWWAEEMRETMRVVDSLPESAVLTVRYEDLVTEPNAVMAGIADFIGATPSHDLDIFASSVGRWKDEMPTEAQEHAVTRHGELLERLGYVATVSAHRIVAPTSVPRIDFDMKKRNDGTRYMTDLVLPLHAVLKCVTMREVGQGGEPCFFLRHDVDDDMDAALQMALLEKGHGIRASYFLLPPSPTQGKTNYYGTIDENGLRPNQTVIDQARQLIEWGHEVGLHNNIAELAVYLKRTVAEVLAEQVEFFASHGIKLVGSAAHGGPFFHENGFVSFEIFAEAGVKPGFERGRTIEVDGQVLKLHTLSQADYGFAFEAYSLPYEIGLNDSNGMWGGKLVRHSPHPELNELKGERYLSAFREMVATAHPKSGVQTLQVLVHPEHWGIC